VAPLLPLVFSLAAVASLGTLVLGWRLLRTTGLEQVERGLAVAAGTAPERPRLMIRLVDGLGLAGQRSLLRLIGDARLSRIDQLLDAAGRPEALTTASLVRRQAGFVALGLLCAAFLLLGGRSALAVVTVLLATGWMPAWLWTTARRRQTQVAAQLPDFLDVLAVTVSAGLSLKAAMERVSAADGGPLGEEIAKVLDDMRYGESRRRALERLRERNPAPSVVTFVTAMLQAEELGTPIAGALSDIAAEVRRETAQRVRQQAAKAAPKVSLVVTTFIVPGSVLLIVAAMVLANLPKLQGLFS